MIYVVVGDHMEPVNSAHQSPTVAANGRDRGQDFAFGFVLLIYIWGLSGAGVHFGTGAGGGVKSWVEPIQTGSLRCMVEFKTRPFKLPLTS